jgi:4-hydroxy-4-methyl-2-oxoglutarate aldolase
MTSTPRHVRAPGPSGPPAAARGHATATLYEASGLDIALDPALRPAWPGAWLTGPAFTVRGDGGDNLALHRAVAAAPPGHVLVADHQGAQHGHWGEILAVAAQVRGLLGLVIDGAVRDVDELCRLGFPVFSRGVRITRTTKIYPGALGVPVTVGGIQVSAGDLVVADADGVVAIPAGHLERVLDAADARVATEERHLAALRAGATTLELYGLGGGPDDDRRGRRGSSE